MYNTRIILESRRFARFIAVGLLNTAFGYGVFAFVIFCGFHYIWASLLSTVLGILFNFFATGRLVFNNHDNSRLGRFFCVYGVNFVFGLAGLALLNELRVDLYLAGLILIPPSAVLTYLLNRLFVFRAY